MFCHWGFSVFCCFVKLHANGIRGKFFLLFFIFYDCSMFKLVGLVIFHVFINFGYVLPMGFFLFCVVLLKLFALWDMRQVLLLFFFLCDYLMFKLVGLVLFHGFSNFRYVLSLGYFCFFVVLLKLFAKVV